MAFTAAEVVPGSDQLSDKGQLSRLGEECWDFTKKSVAVAKVVGEGLTLGLVDGAEAAWADKKGTAVKLASSLAIGTILGMAERGPVLMKSGAVLAGLGFAGMFAYDALHHSGSIIDTVSNTWKNGATDDNIKAMRQNLGQYVFDTGLMLAGGLASGKITNHLNMRSGEPAGDVTTFRGLDRQLKARLDELLPGGSALGAFAADIKPGKGADIFEQVNDVLRDRKGAYKFGDQSDRAAFNRDQVINSDERATQLRGRIADIADQAQANKNAIQVASRELSELREKKHGIEHSSVEVVAVKSAERSLADLEAQRSQIPELEEQMNDLRRQAQEEQSREQQEGTGKKVTEDDASLTPLQRLQEQLTRTRQYVAEITRSLDENNPQSAINCSRQTLSQAQENLRKAQAQPKEDRLKEIQGQIDVKAGDLGKLKEKDKNFGRQLYDAIKALEERVAEVKADPSKAIAKTITAVEAEAPVVEAPVVTKAPAIAEAPVVTKAPAIAEAPVVTKAPAMPEAPVVTKAPAMPEAPAVAKAAVMPEVPAVTKAAVMPEAPVVADEPAAEVAQEAQFELASKQSQIALDQAKASVAEFRHQEALYQQAQETIKQARHTIAAIESGRQLQDSPKREEILVACKHELTEAQQVRPPRYFRTMSMVRAYAKSVEGVLASAPWADDAAIGVSNLHEMLDNLKNSRQGANGESALMDADQFAKAGISAEKMLSDIRTHLDHRLSEMNERHSSRTQEIIKNPVIKEAFARADKGEFPANAAILFYQDGKLVKYRDGSGRMSNAYFDVQHPTGNRRPDRLIGTEPDGYVVIGPRLKADGTPAMGKRFGDGEPLLIKEVLFASGNVPQDTVTRGTDELGNPKNGTSLGDLLHTDRQRTMEVKKPA